MTTRPGLLLLAVVLDRFATKFADTEFEYECVRCGAKYLMRANTSVVCPSCSAIHVDRGWTVPIYPLDSAMALTLTPKEKPVRTYTTRTKRRGAFKPRQRAK